MTILKPRRFGPELRILVLSLAAVLHGHAQLTQPASRFATYLGPDSKATRVATDSTGYVYVSGSANSPKFPCTVSSPEGATANAPFGFLTKLKPNGDATLWTSCFTGPIQAIAWKNGNLYAAESLPQSDALLQIDQDTGKLISSRTIPDAQISTISLDSAGNVYLGGVAGTGFAPTPGSFVDTRSYCAT